MKLTPHKARYFMVAAIISFVIPNLLMFSVIPHLGAGYTGIMFTLSPVMTLTLSVLLLELSELEAISDDDPGTEQLAVMAKFEAELVIGFRTPEAKQSIRLLAASLAAWLRMRRWTNYSGTTPKLPTGEALVIGAYQDDFNIYGRDSSKGLEQYEIWRVEWQQRINLGKTIWTNEGTVPTDVFAQDRINGGSGDGYEKLT